MIRNQCYEDAHVVLDSRHARLFSVGGFHHHAYRRNCCLVVVMGVVAMEGAIVIRHSIFSSFIPTLGNSIHSHRSISLSRTPLDISSIASEENQINSNQVMYTMTKPQLSSSEMRSPTLLQKGPLEDKTNDSRCLPSHRKQVRAARPTNKQRTSGAEEGSSRAAQEGRGKIPIYTNTTQTFADNVTWTKKSRQKPKSRFAPQVERNSQRR